MRTVLILTLCLLLASLQAFARDPVLGMSERVFKVIEDAQTAMDEEQFDVALNTLTTLDDRRLSNYEQAQVLRIAGIIHYNAGDLDRALASLAEARSQPRLPDSLVANLLATIARVALNLERYDEAEVSLNDLMALPNQQTPVNRVLLANAYVGQNKHRQALHPLRKAITEVQTNGEKPQESWLSMLASTLYTLEEFEDMRDVLVELSTLYPREQYLMNLAALHGQLGDQARQLALIEALLESNRLQLEPHIKLVANLFLAESTPFKAATLLQAKIDDGTIADTRENLELLSHSWYAAGNIDKALYALTQAAAQAEVGDVYMRLAGLHMDLYHWQDAEAAAAKALALGDLRNEGNAWLIRGMALANQKKWRSAHDDTSSARHNLNQAPSTPANG